MRTFSKKLILVALILFARPVLAGGAQYWQTFSVEGKVYKNLSLQIAEEMRFDDDMSALYYVQTDIGLLYSVTNWFRCGGMYRNVFENRGYDVDASFNTWRQEQRPLVNWYFDLKTPRVVVSDRNQLEFRFIDGSSFKVRYRNKLSVEFPFKVAPVVIAPYVADEIFVDINKEVLNMNRFYVGTKFKFIEKFAVELYYMLLSSEKTNYWANVNVVGFKAGYNF
jgi:hypothetical protein